MALHRGIGSFDNVREFLAVSGFVRDKHLQAGFDPARIVVKPNFVPATEKRIGPGGDFLFLGRLSAEKGLEQLMRIWRDVPARLVVVGDGPERKAVEQAAPSTVEFRGSVAPEVVPSLLRAARALVLPSICYEGAPRTVIEAFAAGVPVVGSRLGAIPELVEDGVTGTLAAPGDAHGWRVALQTMLDDRESIRMGTAAAEVWLERFSPGRAAVDLERVYTRAVGGPDPGAAPSGTN